MTNKKTGNLNSHSIVVINKKYNFFKFLSIIYDGRELDNTGLTRKYNQYIESLEWSKEVEKNKTIIGVTDKNGNYVGTFPSALEVSKYLNLKIQSIYYYLDSKNDPSGYSFKALKKLKRKERIENVEKIRSN